MRRYEFRLHAVLRARRAQEDIARQSLALANRSLREAQRHLGAERIRYEALEPTVGLGDWPEARRERSWCDLAAASVAHATRCFEDLAVVAADRQAAWREAARRVAVLERLDDRRRADHALWAARADGAEIDDLVTARFLPPDAELFEDRCAR